MSSRYRATGRLIFIALLPLTRQWIKRTSRAYVLLKNGQDFLLVKNWFSRQKWQLPGGGIHTGEDPKKAVVREVSEEVGIELKSQQLRPLHHGVWRTDRLGHNYQVFTATIDKHLPKRLKQEIVAAAWLPIAELNPDNTTEEVMEAINAL